MKPYLLVSMLFTLLAALVSGCGGTPEPVNEGKDVPIPLKKAEQKDK